MTPWRMAAAILVAWMIPSGIVTGHAEVPADARARFSAAIARFEALAAQTTKADDRLPQLSRADERPVLDALWDAALLGRPPYTRDDIDALEKLGTRAQGVERAYLGGEPPSERDRQLFRVSPVILEHAQKYPDEIVRSNAFVLQIFVDRLAAYADAWTHRAPSERPALEAAIAPLRNAVAQKLFTVPRLLAEPTNPLLSEASKKLWADLLARNAETIADATPRLMREVVVLELQNALPRLPEALRDDVQRLVTAMTQRPCADLCLVDVAPDAVAKP